MNEAAIFAHEIEYDGELKPCPFCGGKARLTLWYGYSPSYQDYSVNTYRCGCDECELYRVFPWDMEIVVEKWNQRR